MQGQFVDAPANHVIFGYLRALKGLLARFGLHIGTYQKSGSRKGVADILCCMYPSGSFLAIEIKNGLTNDKMSEDQVEYMREINKAGGDYWIVTSFDQFKELYNNSKWSYQTIR